MKKLLFATAIFSSFAMASKPTTFEVKCGVKRLSVEKLILEDMTLYGVLENNITEPLPLNCHLDPLKYKELGVFCKNSKGGFEISNTALVNYRNRRLPVLDNRLSIGSWNGQIARPHMEIKQSGSEIVFSTHNSSYPQMVKSLYVNMNDTSASCEVLPFTWSDNSGC